MVLCCELQFIILNMKTVNVICIKWGDRYPAHYVNKLHSMVKKNLTLKHRFVCLTEESEGLDSKIEVIPIPDIYVRPDRRNSPWRKISMCARKLGDLSGKTLFLDLDLIIVDNIDCFFTYSDTFSIIENWTQLGRGIGNSSVYCFEIGKHFDVLEYFGEHADEIYEKYGNSQTYLSKKIGDINFWPEQWCRSFKFHSIPKGINRFFKPPSIPDGCRILVFHGDPNPDQGLVGDYGSKLRKYFKPAPWISEYWKD